MPLAPVRRRNDSVARAGDDAFRMVAAKKAETTETATVLCLAKCDSAGRASVRSRRVAHMRSPRPVLDARLEAGSCNVSPRCWRICHHFWIVVLRIRSSALRTRFERQNARIQSLLERT